MKRLIKKSDLINEIFNVDDFDLNTRDEAFVYLNGTILIGNTNHDRLLEELYSQEPFSNMKYSEIEKLPIVFGHILTTVDNKKAGVIEKNSYINKSVTPEEVFKVLKAEDNSIEECYLFDCSNNQDEIIKIAKRLIKKSDDDILDKIQYLYHGSPIHNL